MLDVEHLARDERPCQEVAAPVQSCKETISFSPDHVLILVVHTHTVDEIQVRQRQNHYVFVALNERVAAAKLALVDMTAIATNSIIQLVLLYLASKKLKKVEHVEATRGLL